jgi:hypothetical protein
MLFSNCFVFLSVAVSKIYQMFYNSLVFWARSLLKYAQHDHKIEDYVRRVHLRINLGIIRLYETLQG